MRSQTTNQQVLEKALGEFQHRYRYSEEVLSYLRRDDVKVVRVERGQQGRWSLFCVLPETTQRIFDIDREILMLATDHPKLEPRILSEIQRQLRENARVDDQLALLVTIDPSAHRLARQRAGETAILTIDATRLDANAPVLRRALSHLLTSVDHFNVTTPLTAASAFFGRDRDIASVRQCLGVGQHVGIFGLRKAGKSSLLNRVSTLQREHGWAVAHLDLNEYIGTPTRFRSEVVRLFADEAKRLGAKPGRLSSVAASRGDTVREHWLRDLASVMELLANQQAAGAVLVVDEIDTALPGRTLAVDEGDDELGLLRAISQLRAFIQRLQSRDLLAPVLLCAGVDPSLFEKPKIKQLANPLYQFATVQFIEPMDRDELQAMVRALGKRTGMRFRDADLIDELHAEYGGHPLLTRQACSYLHRHRPAGEVPYMVSVSELQKAFSAKGPGTPLDHALDMPSSFEEWYPNEAAELETIIRLARSGETIVGDRRVDHAIAYGLLNSDGSIGMRALTRVS